MNYPLISEYIEAIKAAEDNLNQLSHLRPVLNDDGQPVMSSGNFAVVFKMKDVQTGKLHALKCFLKDQEGRAEAYKEIAKELENVSSTFLTPIKYFENELFVDSNATDDIEVPVLLMDWIEGVPLDKYVRENIDDSYELELLTWNFKLMATWLLEQPFAHGDLKPDNIIVRDDGTMVLVDYDGMYVPAMKGQCARELGSPDFRHPQRTEQDFDKHIDDFPIVSIALSLKAIALEPELLERYGAKDRLLFSEADYRDLRNCHFVKENFPSQSPELDMLYALFLMVWRDSKRQGNSILAIMETAISQPELPIENTYSTEVTEEDIENAWEDEYGAKYSTDKKRLLKVPHINDYYILEGTLVIGDDAFRSCERLRDIIIPDSVTKIGDGAFHGCSSLQTIIFSKSLTQIGTGAFRGCRNLDCIVIPDFVTQIGDGLFCDCWDLGVIDIPNSVTRIGDDAFKGCERLQNIVIPDSVIQIGNEAFRGCWHLESIDIPNSVIQIGTGAFRGCHNLQHIVIPDSVTKIGNDAFNDCDNLLSIVIPKSLIQIGTGAFCYCHNLQSIVIPDSVTQIGDVAFFECWNLESIEIPNSVTRIGNDSFAFCFNLQSIVIPDSVTQISNEAFRGCSSLRSIVVSKGNSRYDSRNNCNAIIETDSNTLVVGCSRTVIVNSVTQIGNNAFKDCHDLYYTYIPDSVIQIGDGAFSGCENLLSIIIPDSVMQIGDAAFSFCTSLQSIVIPKGTKEKFQKLLPDHKHLLREQLVKDIVINQPEQLIIYNYSTKVTEYDLINAWEDNYGAKYSSDGKRLLKGPNIKEYRILKGTLVIGDKAFDMCSNLQSIVIPDSVTKIGYCAFSSCISLQSIVIPDSVIQISDGAFLACHSIQSIVIPDSVTKIGGCAFSYCKELQTIVIPDSVTEIGNSAFSYCKELQSIVIPDSVTIIGNWAFLDCKKMQSIIIPDSIKEIGNDAFSHCEELQSIVIPDSVTHIGYNIFTHCNRLLSITVAKGNKKYDSRNNCNAIIETASNELIVGYATTRIPDTVTRIGSFAFSYCKELQSIAIPEEFH